MQVDPGLRSSPEWSLLKAMASWRIGQFEESRRSALAALESYRGRGDGDGEMRAQNVAAAGDFALGNLEEARSGFERALDLARRFDDRLMMARCANNLGNVAYYAGSHAKALHHYSHGASLFGQVGSLSGMAEAWHNTAVVQREKGDLDAAQDAADRALDAAERLGDSRMMGWALGGRGETDAMRGDLPLGWAQAKRAVNLAREHDDRLTEIDSLRIMAYIARQRGQEEQSLDLAQKATSLASEVDNPWMYAKANQELAYSLRQARRDKEAYAALAVAAEAFDKTGAHARAAELRSTRGQI
jgi:tetratricopeptide (TPR) repeat protein